MYQSPFILHFDRKTKIPWYITWWALGGELMMSIAPKIPSMTTSMKSFHPPKVFWVSVPIRFHPPFSVRLLLVAFSISCWNNNPHNVGYILKKWYRPKKSVVQNNHLVWGTQNLYVVDSSILPTSHGANPMQTIHSIAYLATEDMFPEEWFLYW